MFNILNNKTNNGKGTGFVGTALLHY